MRYGNNNNKHIEASLKLLIFKKKNEYFFTYQY